MKVRSPRLSSTNWCRIRSAVAGPTTISPPSAEPARRAATLVVGPVAVNVQRWPVAPPSLVAPTRASPVLMPMWSCTGGKTPPYSSLRVPVRWRTAKAARVASRAWSPPARSDWKMTMRPSPAVSLMSPCWAWMISRKLEKYVCTSWLSRRGSSCSLSRV
ncbi:MAG TPA: hypothetical protein VFX28_14225 [Methylomirabilota bacterium]|nr:hypothetical protein [Methylomirabilota bacterium]